MGMRVSLLGLGAAALLAGFAAHALAAPAATVTPVAKVSETIAGQPITAPSGPLQMTVSHYDIPPGASLAVHRHDYPRYAYVLAGTLEVVNEDTGTTHTFTEGDFIAEAVGQWHFGRTLGDTPVKLLVIDEAPPGTENIVMPK